MTGLLFGDTAQFYAQCIGIAANIVYVATTTAIALFVIGKLTGNRVSAEDEVAGLDVPEMGVLAYPDDPHTTPPPYGAGPGSRAPALTPRTSRAPTSY